MKKILELSGKTFDDLPRLQRCVSQLGKNKLCYQHVCGVCPRGPQCFMHVEMRGHPEWRELDCVDTGGQHFIDHLWATIREGVEYILKHGENYTPGGQGERRAGKRKCS